MRYYLYISDAKVNMLLPEISPSVKKRLIGELKLNFGVVAGTIRERTDNIYSRVDNLRLVESFIRQNERVASLNDYTGGEVWLAGTHPCYAVTLDDDAAAVLFIGEDDRIVLALGGSSNHLIGDDGRNPVSIGWSFLPRLVQALSTFTKMEAAMGGHYPALPEEPGQWHETVQLAIKRCQQSASPLIQIDFLARVLLSHNEKQRPFILASPLYVALEQ